ncbi:MerR family transcriptional regulator [Roseovarius aquimarinus]|uniref:MerR family transcriptional regulator n=1 Tax=Roseovarius aquimarinus TaxID=1229156 RepID=A0ABW7I3M5_9RHOB
MSKSADAFRTISEVADWLGIPAHVLRFWESKFSQVKPVKRAGGRRYYRPADMQLLGGIRKLLHDEGMTIKGVQKIMREQGVRHVAAMSPPLEADLEHDIETEDAGIALDVEEEDAPRGEVVNFGRMPAPADVEAPAEPATAEDGPEVVADAPPEAASLPGEDTATPAHIAEEAPSEDAQSADAMDEAEEPAAPVTATPASSEDVRPATAQDTPGEIAAPEPPAPHDDSRGGADLVAPEADAAPPAPRVIETPDDPADDAAAPAPAIRLAELAARPKASPEAAARYAEIAARLGALRKRMGDGRKSS